MTRAVEKGVEGNFWMELGPLGGQEVHSSVKFRKTDTPKRLRRQRETGCDGGERKLALRAAVCCLPDDREPRCGPAGGLLVPCCRFGRALPALSYVHDHSTVLLGGMRSLATVLVLHFSVLPD